MTLIANTTVLSNFALIQHPELIRIGCPGGVVTAAQVMEEMRRGVASRSCHHAIEGLVSVRTLDTPEEVRFVLNRSIDAWGKEKLPVWRWL